MPRGAPCTPDRTLLTAKQRQRLTTLFTDDKHAGVEATWGI
jgi:hypothetical protein